MLSSCKVFFDLCLRILLLDALAEPAGVPARAGSAGDGVLRPKKADLLRLRTFPVVLLLAVDLPSLFAVLCCLVCANGVGMLCWDVMLVSGVWRLS